LGDRDKVTATAQEKGAPPARGPQPVRTREDLHAKIEEVKARVEEASKPTGPLGLFGLTTST
jgi:hypothetical protein